jgi:hypothetical protein
MDEDGRDFLRLASVLAVAPVQASFVLEVFELLYGDGTAKSRAVKAVNQAETLSLCERSGEDLRAVHTLVSRTMRFQFPSEERTASLRSAAVQALTRRLKEVPHIGEHSRIVMDIPHARHMVAEDLQTNEQANLALCVANRDYERADYGSARKLEEQVLEVRRRTLGEEHRGTLAAMDNLALTLSDQGDLGGARKLQEQVLAASRRVLGEEHPDTLRTMNNLASTLFQHGDRGGARKLQERVLEASRRVQGEEHPDTLSAMNNLASTLCNQGDLGGARKLQEQVLEAHRRMQGEEHPVTLKAMSSLASTLSVQGNLGGARKLQEQVLAASRRVLGEEHPVTLKAMNNLALTLCDQGDLGGARKLQEQVLAASRRVLGEEHPGTLRARTDLAQMAAKDLLNNNQRVTLWQKFRRLVGRTHEWEQAAEQERQRQAALEMARERAELQKALKLDPSDSS